MTLNLQKGGNLSLHKAAPDLSDILIGFGWNEYKSDGSDFDLDASAFLLTASDKVRSDADFIFYNQLKSNDGAVEHVSDTYKGQGNNNFIKVDLSNVSTDIAKIVFTVTIHDAKDRQQNFSQVTNSFICLINNMTGMEVVRYDLAEDYTTETAMIFGELYRHNGEWKFRAVGQGYTGGLNTMCTQYGISLENKVVNQNFQDQHPLKSDELQRLNDVHLQNIEKIKKEAQRLHQQEINEFEEIKGIHTKNTELLKKEAQRLLLLEMNTLQDMMKAEGVIVDAASNSQQTFDRTTTPKHIEVLRGEHTKLENMELVIAVVGTMKAGKSTTINAIVGTEVLPNRNRPMTALPTLIRHTPNKIEPEMVLNNDPINKLFKTLNACITDSKTDKSVLSGLSTDPDMAELIGNIHSKQVFGTTYKGANDIFWCLKTLNDLVRLSSALKVDFPFSDYDEMHEMPVIEVEFTHLRESKQVQGRLTLLDTPGPNEDGQDHLRHMLTEQLKKTSGVLAVFDYSQLKSDADAQVRAELKNIAKLHKGRLFALVNKFDQKDRNGDSAEEVKKLVAKKLMDGLIDEHHVFPVSSMLGYLANHAKQQMSTNNKLPDYNKESWVKDFAEKAFGSSWEDDDLSDNDAVTKAAEKLWKKSGFYDPMENVIRAAHSQAALLALDSASEKLAMYTNEIENFLGSRHGSLSQSAEALKNRIAVLKENITNIERIEKDAKDKIESTLNRLMKDSEETIENSKKKIKANLEKYFEEGKRVEEKEIATRQREADSKRSASPLDLIFSGLRDATAQSRQDFDPNRPIITFSKESDANELLEGVKESVIKEIKDNQSILDRDIEKSLKNVGIDFAKNVNSAEAIIATIQAEMSGEGFKVNLKSPNTDKLNPIFRNSNFSLAAESTTREESYRVEKDGIGSWFARKLWGGGYETRYRDVKEFIIDIAEIKKTVEGNIEKTFDGYKSEIDREVIKPLNAEVNKFFIDLKATIEKIKSNLEQGIKDQQKDQVGIDTLKKNLEQFLKDVPDLKEDNECLTHDIKVLIHKKNKVAA